MERIAIIVAMGTKTKALGKDGQLLWHIPDDMRRFKELTTGHPVVMGRRTWESLPLKFRPLPERTNIVVTRQADFKAEGAVVTNTLAAASAAAARAAGVGEIFVIGGGELYREALPLTDRLYLTLIDDDKDGDAFFPSYEKVFTKVISEESRDWNGLKYRWVTLERF